MYTRALWICGCNHALADEVFQLRLFTWLRTREERQLGGTSCAETEAHTWPRSDSEVPGAGSPAGKAATGRNRGFDRAVVTMDLNSSKRWPRRPHRSGLGWQRRGFARLSGGR
jgi:hypothetical protein